MDWVATLVSAIASIRLILIFSGMLMLLRCMIQRNTQSRYFALSGIAYLFGLLPQSLVLLVDSDFVTHMLDNVFLCWIQKFACILAVALQSVVFLNWIFAITESYDSFCIDNTKAFVKHKVLVHALAIYVILLTACRVFYLRVDDGRRFFTDVVSRANNTSSSEWTLSPVQNPAHVVRLQLLLCESSISANDMKNFLISSYLLLFLPMVWLCFILKPLITQQKQALKVSKICHPDSSEGWQHYAWWEQEVNIQRIFSTLIMFWYYVLQPTVFAFHKQHFVDFGTHLLLTICVFIPWTLPTAEYKTVQSWV